MSQSTIFQLRLDGSSCVELVLSKDKWVFLEDTKHDGDAQTHGP